MKKDRLGNLPQLTEELYSPEDSAQTTEVHGFLQDKKGIKQFQGANKKPDGTDFVSVGSHIGQELKRSPKLQVDPVLELKHIIGYSGDRCQNLKWSKQPSENVVIFTSGGTLIAMDVDDNS